jgi:hypothetical protein
LDFISSRHLFSCKAPNVAVYDLVDIWKAAHW